MGKGIDPKTGKDYIRISAKDWPNYDNEFEDISLETALSARQTNGELPLKFARPKVGSIFEDKGMPIENFYCQDIFKDYYYKTTDKWLDDYSTTLTLPYYGSAPDYGAYEAGWERPAFDLQTLPVNDGTLFEATPTVNGLPADIIELDGKQYTVMPLIDDYLFQEPTLPATVTQYLTDAATANKILPTYYGKSGTYPTKIGALYGGGTLGAYVLAKSSGFIELTLPSLSVLRSFLYGGGKSSTIKVQWKKQGDSNWTAGETFTFDQRMMAIDFTHYGVPLSATPVVVRLNSTGSNDVYMTNLVASGFEETAVTGIDIAAGRNGSQSGSFQVTANGIIAYGDVATISVFDTAGRQVAQSCLSQFCNLANVGKGIYTVVATTKDGSKNTRKIMRQ